MYKQKQPSKQTALTQHANFGYSEILEKEKETRVVKRYEQIFSTEVCFITVRWQQKFFC